MPEKSKKTEKTGKIEREYTIPLKEKTRVVPRYKKANKAIKTIKEFLVRHMKIRDRDLNKIKIDKYLNEVIWSRGIRKPPHKVKVKAIKEQGSDIIRVELSELPQKLKFKKVKEERRERKASEVLERKKKAQKPGEAAPEQRVKEKTETEKAEEKEKKSAVVEAGKEIEKAAAKKMKHEAKGKAKQPKHQQRKALAK